MLKESEKCDWKEVQLCRASPSCVGNSTVLPLQKGSSLFVVRHKGSAKGWESRCKGGQKYLFSSLHIPLLGHTYSLNSLLSKFNGGLEVLGYRRKTRFRRGDKLYFLRDAKLVILSKSQRRQGQALGLWASFLHKHVGGTV